MGEKTGTVESAPENQRHRPWPGLSLMLVAALLLGVAGAIAVATAPLATLAGPSRYAIAGAIHGLSATLLFIVSVVGLYLGFRLWAGRIRAFPDLQLVTTVIAATSFLTILFGNWIYIPYRAKVPDSPRSFFLANAPEIHKIFFEFKEFAALFTLPLAVAATYILWRYGRQILDRTWTRTAVALLLALHFFYFSAAFGLGAAVTKLKSI